MKLKAQTFCDVMWHGRKHRFALAIEQGLLHFWESMAFPDTPPQERLFVVIEEVHEWICGPSEKDIDLDKLHRLFLFKWVCAERGQRSWARVVAFDDKTDVLLHPSGRGEIRILCPEDEDYHYLEAPPRAFQQNELRLPFLFGGSTNVMEWSLAQWHQELHRWKTLPDHDFAFALAWLETADEDKPAQLYQFSQGDWKEMERVAEWIAVLESDALSSDSPDENGHISEVSVSLMFCSGEDVLPRAELHVHGGHFPALWQTWFNFFTPSLNHEILEQHIAARRDMNSANQEFLIGGQHLTAHERIETHLQLRDWLQERVGLSNEHITQILCSCQHS